MAPKTNKSNSGLGRAIINRRTKQRAQEYQDELHRTSLPSGLHSVTQENDLDEFLNTAQLANTDFTAERNNTITLVSSGTSSNPYLLSQTQERELRQRQQKQGPLRVPRRPEWTADMDKEVFEQNERASFLEWRRALAELTDQQAFLLTPFERNLAVWRQLWRTTERSQLIVQIVDARNPLNFRCEDLESYVSEVPVDVVTGKGKGKRRNLLLVNKADLLTRKQRRAWARYFKNQNIAFAFFSALDATALQERQAKQEEEVVEIEELAQFEEDQEEEDEHTKVLTVEALEALFISSAPPLIDFATDTQPAPTKLTIGLVGYPNVGKSSTINALIGAKKVSVSSTPGKTKNFQTIHLSEEIILCDCPGLVFPQFASTKADLVLDGVLPIDQMREWTAPVDLLCNRIPKEVLEAVYGLTIQIKPVEEGGTGKVGARDLLSVYAIARGFFTQGQGNPDESRSARPILKDYVNGKLLYAHAPPGEDAASFNSENRDLDRLRRLEKVKAKRAPTTRVGQNANTFVPTATKGKTGPISPQSSALDRDFFGHIGSSSLPSFKGTGAGPGSARVQLYAGQKILNNDGTPLRQMQDLKVAEGKKHFKGKRTKQRSGYGFD